MKERNWIEVSYGYLKRRIRLGKKEHSQQQAKKKEHSQLQAKKKEHSQQQAKKKSTANSRQKKEHSQLQATTSAVGAGGVKEPSEFGQSCAETRDRSAACFELGFHSSAWRTSITLRVAGFAERGPTARSIRAELLGD